MQMNNQEDQIDFICLKASAVPTLAFCPPQQLNSGWQQETSVGRRSLIMLFLPSPYYLLLLWCKQPNSKKVQLAAILQR